MDSIIPWVGLCAAGGFILTLIKFWLSFNDRILVVGKDSDKKIDALREEREQAGHSISAQIGAMQGSFALYREQMAREQRDFITQEMMREFERRIERSTKESTDRIFDAIKDLTNRVNRVIEDRPRPSNT